MSEGKKSGWALFWEGFKEGWKEAGTFPETDNVDHGVYAQRNNAADEAECDFLCDSGSLSSDYWVSDLSNPHALIYNNDK